MKKNKLISVYFWHREYLNEKGEWVYDVTFIRRNEYEDTNKQYQMSIRDAHKLFDLLKDDLNVPSAHSLLSTMFFLED